MKKLQYLFLVAILCASCSIQKETISKKLSDAGYSCKDDICYYDDYINGIYDSFDLTHNPIWDITQISPNADYYLNTTILNFKNDELILTDLDKKYTCSINSANLTINECNPASADSQKALDYLMKRLDDMGISYKDFK